MALLLQIEKNARAVAILCFFNQKLVEGDCLDVSSGRMALAVEALSEGTPSYFTRLSTVRLAKFRNRYAPENELVRVRDGQNLSQPSKKKRLQIIPSGGDLPLLLVLDVSRRARQGAHREGRVLE